MAKPKSLLLVASLFLAGCASGHNPRPEGPQASAQDRRGAEQWLLLGQEAAARGDAVRAEQYLTLAIKEGASRQQVMPLLLSACLRSSHLRAALNYSEPYLLEHPEDDALRYLVATIHLGLGQRAAAKKELDLLLQRNPRDPDAHYLAGIIESTADLELARRHFAAVIEHSLDEDQKTEVESRMAQLSLRLSESSFEAGSEP